ncbi:hypothetical protein [Flavobacterium panacagri]|uniref:hypothetical protein n=1 Tax=Flavobacterium panacagri TaxID=3034146 RepID=UPI0025A66C0C|nr:hypothetical protein [Flavobacterium panacagri]
MQKLVFFLILISFVFKATAQHNSKINYDGLLKLEGIEYVGGITFYIEKKSQILMAVQNHIIKWKADVVKECGKRKTKINSVSVRSEKLKVSFGKNKNALVDIINGKIECLAEESKKDEKGEYINFKNNNITKK